MAWRNGRERKYQSDMLEETEKHLKGYKDARRMSREKTGSRR